MSSLVIMRIKQLSTAEQIKLLKELDSQEREFDKNQSLNKGNEYSLKYVHGMDLEPPSEDSLKNAISYRPITNQLKNIESLLSNNLAERQHEDDDVEEVVIDDVDDEFVGEIVLDEVLAKYKLPKFTDINEKNAKHVKNLIKKTNKSIGYMKSSLKKSGYGKSDVYKVHDTEIKVLQNLQKDIDVFFSKKQQSGEGSGLVKFGKFYIDNKALKGGSLKIRKANHGKVHGIDDCVVSPTMIQALKKKRCDPSLSSDEVELFNKIMKSCKLKVDGRGVVLTNENEVIERFFVLLGEIKAGNTSNLLKTELVHLADFLLKKNHISKDTYIDIMNSMKEF